LIVLDTTILVYAVGGEHPLQAPCRGVVALARDDVVRATTTVEVLQEFTHVRAKRRPRQEAAARAREFATGLGPLLLPELDDLIEGLELFEQSDQLGAFDAVLAAASRRRGWMLASADHAFRQVGGLGYLDPALPGFLDDVRRTR
jgi:predicted nucleic acid-binding protein